ncbi:MAG: hypothetical protein KDJ37_02375 [Hyphomicrobiaceae bacterium]|nr:hypothetical protein [Hyphomicrobiaceae bacterium]
MTSKNEVVGQRGVLAHAASSIGGLLSGMSRAVVRGTAVVAMVAIYGLSSVGSYGLSALGLTGVVSGLTLASSAQPAEARRRRRRSRRRRGVSLPFIVFGRGRGRRRRRRRRR